MKLIYIKFTMEPNKAQAEKITPYVLKPMILKFFKFFKLRILTPTYDESNLNESVKASRQGFPNLLRSTNDRSCSF